MKFRFDPHHDHVVIKLSGNVMGGPGYEPLHEQVRNLVQQGHHCFVIDLSAARWINSTGLGIIISIFRTVREAGGRMAVCGANKRIRGIYFVSQLDKMFQTYQTVDEGVEAVTAA